MDTWATNHAQDYIKDHTALTSQIERCDKYVKKTKRIATIAAILIFILFGYLIYQSEKVDLESILFTPVLAAAIYGCTRLLIMDFWKNKNRDVYNSVKQFKKDWKNLRQLEQDFKDHEHHLRDLGRQVADAHQMKQIEVEKRLMKIFKRDHQTLINFGMTRYHDYGVFIPSKRKEVVRVTLRQIF